MRFLLKDISYGKLRRYMWILLLHLRYKSNHNIPWSFLNSARHTFPNTLSEVPTEPTPAGPHNRSVYNEGRFLVCTMRVVFWFGILDKTENDTEGLEQWILWRCVCFWSRLILGTLLLASGFWSCVNTPATSMRNPLHFRQNILHEVRSLVYR